MKGFDIKHQYVTVDGFDITGYAQQYGSSVLITFEGNNCQILNNVIRDGVKDVYGITFYSSSGKAASSCTVRGNKLTNLLYQFVTVRGGNHLFENNIFELQNSMDYVRLFGHDHIFRRNIFRNGPTNTEVSNHTDFVQTFGNTGEDANNILFEENWISDLESQFSQLTTDALSGIHDWTFRRNVVYNIRDNGNISIPGVRFDHNTFYRLSYSLGGLYF